LNAACLQNAVPYSAIVMSGAWITRKWKFLFSLLVNVLSHSLALGRCFMKDLTVTHCKMETAVGTVILTSLHFQSS